MVISRTRNKITDFLMILAWASPFKKNKDEQFLRYVWLRKDSWLWLCVYTGESALCSINPLMESALCSMNNSSSDHSH